MMLNKDAERDVFIAEINHHSIDESIMSYNGAHLLSQGTTEYIWKVRYSLKMFNIIPKSISQFSL